MTVWEDQIAVEPNSGCWLWLGATYSNGYGLINVSPGKTQLAHRAVWEEANGPIPVGMLACHKCDVKSCVNPDHIYLGSKRDNALDALARGQLVPARGEATGKAVLTERQVKELRALRAAGATYKALREQFGVAHSTAHAIVSGKSWGWLK